MKTFWKLLGVLLACGAAEDNLSQKHLHKTKLLYKGQSLRRKRKKRQILTHSRVHS